MFWRHRLEFLSPESCIWSAVPRAHQACHILPLILSWQTSSSVFATTVWTPESTSLPLYAHEQMLLCSYFLHFLRAPASGYNTKHFPLLRPLSPMQWGAVPANKFLFAPRIAFYPCLMGVEMEYAIVHPGPLRWNNTEKDLQSNFFSQRRASHLSCSIIVLNCKIWSPFH